MLNVICGSVRLLVRFLNPGAPLIGAVAAALMAYFAYHLNIVNKSMAENQQTQSEIQGSIVQLQQSILESEEARDAPQVVIRLLHLIPYRPDPPTRIDSIKVRAEITNYGGSTAKKVVYWEPMLRSDTISAMLQHDPLKGEKYVVLPPLDAEPKVLTIKTPDWTTAKWKNGDSLYLHQLVEYCDLMDNSYYAYFIAEITFEISETGMLGYNFISYSHRP
jgi:hypothetical protein